MTVEIDLAGAATRKEFHERVRLALSLPDWYGNNLDALHDVLTEQPELTVRFLHAGQLPGRYAAALKRMSEESGGQIFIDESSAEAGPAGPCGAQY